MCSLRQAAREMKIKIPGMKFNIPDWAIYLSLIYLELTIERLKWYETRPLIDLPHSAETYVLDGMKL